MAPPTTPPRPPEQRAAPGAGATRVQASPVARRLANELGLDLSQIEGTGPEGRVVRADIEAAQAAGLARPPMPAGAVPAAQSEFTPPEQQGPPPPLPEVEPSSEPEVVEPEVQAQAAEAAPEIAAEPEPEIAAEPELEIAVEWIEPGAEAEIAEANAVEAEPPTVEAAVVQPAAEVAEEAVVDAPLEVVTEESDVEADTDPEIVAVTPVAEPDVAEDEPDPEPQEPEAITEPDVVAEPEPVAEPEAAVPEAAVPANEPSDHEPISEQVTLPAAQPGRGKGEPVVVELSRQGQTIARRMAESKATIPHFALRLEVDAHPILALRTELATTRPDMAPPSVNDLVVRATALALRAYPRLNGAYRDGRVEQYPRVNVGIPVDVEDGLPVPVIHDADRLSLGQIAERSAELIEKARANELRAPDVSSATFTVSNLGMLGIDDFEAVITPGQAGMLTVGRIAQRPVVADGQIVVGETMWLTLLVDHRAVYGGPAARFLSRVRQLLEHPTSLLA